MFLVAAFLVGALGRNWDPFNLQGDPYEEVGPTVIEGVRSMAKLASVEMVESTTIEKGNDFGWLNWAREDKIFMFAVARIGAGVDLARMSPGSFEVDTVTGEVSVRLPEAEIIYVSLDSDATTVYSRDTGLFTSGDPQLESDARQAAETILQEQALKAGILNLADENAKTAIAELLQGLGYTRVVFVSDLN